MITNTNFNTSSLAGLPSELEVEALANSLFPDFEPQVCADGIERLATTGDTSVVDTAVHKAEAQLSRYNLGTAELEQLAGEVLEPAGGFSLGIPQTDGGFFEQQALSAAQGAFGVAAVNSAVQEAQVQFSRYNLGSSELEQLSDGILTPASGFGLGVPQTTGGFFGDGAQAASNGAAGYVTSASASPASGGTAFAPQVLSQQQAQNAAPKNEIHVGGGAAPQRNITPASSGGIVIGTKTLAQIRNDFPILQEKVNGHDLVWLDNGATTQRPQAVIDRLVYFYQHENSNIHRGEHELATRSTDAYEGARQTVADFIGAPSKDNIVFVRGTTEAINLIAQSYVKPLLQPGDEIIVTLLEHHANIVPWQLVAQETGAVIKVVPIDASGQLILSEYSKLFTKRTKFVSATHVSNTLGTITPVAELVSIAHAHGVRILIDGAQSIAHIPVNVSALDADFFVFSGHKVYAPTGIGAIYGKSDALEQAKPYHGGGNMIADVTFERTIYNPAPNKFEAGTGNIADAVALGTALDYLSAIGMPAINKWEHELTQYAMAELRKIPGLHLIGTPLHKSGVLSFVLDGHSLHEVGQRLNEFGVAVRAGHHCAQPVLRSLGLEGTVRPVLGIYNSPEDIDALVRGIRSLA